MDGVKRSLVENSESGDPMQEMANLAEREVYVLLTCFSIDITGEKAKGSNGLSLARKAGNSLRVTSS